MGDSVAFPLHLSLLWNFTSPETLPSSNSRKTMDFGRWSRWWLVRSSGTSAAGRTSGTTHWGATPLSNSRTDEDDIREKFLAQTLTKFTITLDESDISNRDQVGKAEQSEFSGTEESPECSVDIEAPPPSSSPSTSDDEVQGAVVEGNDDDLTLFQETNEILFVPMPGQEDTEKRRYVPNGCSICLSCLEPGEKITWSSNPDCTHVYHHDCVIHWFLTVGRKAQCKRLRQDPETRVTKEMLCDFPMTCPCCRQPFCVSEKREEAIRHVVTDSTDSDSTDSDSTTSTD